MKTQKKEIAHPIFIEVSRLSTDVFWITLYENIAFGICPFGVAIDQDSIYSRFKGKQFNYFFGDKTSLEIGEQLTTIFKTKMGISSKLDYLNRRDDFKRVLNLSFYEEWSDIKKKNIRDILIENFVIDLKNKMKLTTLQMHRILNLIIIGFTFKVIINEDVKYDATKCAITDIQGINFQTFAIPKTKPKINVVFENHAPQRMSDLWYKLMNE